MMKCNAKINSKLVGVYRQAPMSVNYLKKTAGTPSGPSIVATRAIVARRLWLGIPIMTPAIGLTACGRRADCRETSLKQTCQKKSQQKVKLV